MSISASIDINLKADIVPSTISITAIQGLIGIGWTFDSDGNVFYLPLGDDDQFNWKTEFIHQEDLFNILKRKAELFELIGVSMTWQKSNVGGDFLFRSDGSISIALSINRKTITGCSSTDLSWYLERLLPGFSRVNLLIERLSYTEHL